MKIAVVVNSRANYGRIKSFLESARKFKTLDLKVIAGASALLAKYGRVIDINSSLEDSPEVVNDDPYGEGWIIKIEVSNPSDIDTLMSSKEYKKLIVS